MVFVVPVKLQEYHCQELGQREDVEDQEEADPPSIVVVQIDLRTVPGYQSDPKPQTAYGCDLKEVSPCL